MKFTIRLAAAALLLATFTVHAADKPAVPTLKVHPKVFSMVNCSVADEEAPVVTEINLDAVRANGEQFFADDVKRQGPWTQCPNDDGSGFYRFRVLEADGNEYTVEFQSNGGGTLTTAVIIECSIEKREITRDGEEKTIRVLRINGFSAKE